MIKPHRMQRRHRADAKAEAWPVAPLEKKVSLVESEAAAATVSHTESAYLRMRDMILSLECRPGTPLPERSLEMTLGASRTPVRAALARLESDGLVMKQGRGYVVTPIDPVEIEKAYEFRIILETACIRAAIRDATLQQMIAMAPAAMGRTPAGEPAREYLHNATGFHLALARLTNNDFFIRSLSDVLMRLARVRAVELQTKAGRQRAWADHQKILGLVRLRDERGAVAEMTRHLTESSKRIIEAVRAAQSRSG